MNVSVFCLFSVRHSSAWYVCLWYGSGVTDMHVPENVVFPLLFSRGGNKILVIPPNDVFALPISI
jgi:hypothetical protein